MIRASDFKRGKDVKTALKRLFWERDMLLDMVLYGRDSFGPCWGIHGYDEDEAKGIYDDYCDGRKAAGKCSCSQYDIHCVLHWLESTHEDEERPEFQNYTNGKVKTVWEILRLAHPYYNYTGSDDF